MYTTGTRTSGRGRAGRVVGPAGVQVGWAVGEIQHAAAQSVLSVYLVLVQRAAVSRPLPAGWVRQRRGALVCKLRLSGGRGGPLTPRRQPLRTVRERRQSCNGNADDERGRFRTRMRNPPSNALASDPLPDTPAASLYCTGYRAFCGAGACRASRSGRHAPQIYRS